MAKAAAKAEEIITNIGDFRSQPFVWLWRGWATGPTSKINRRGQFAASTLEKRAVGE